MDGGVLPHCRPFCMFPAQGSSNFKHIGLSAVTSFRPAVCGVKCRIESAGRKSNHSNAGGSSPRCISGLHLLPQPRHELYRVIEIISNDGVVKTNPFNHPALE